ncbi:MAG: hypothetical protein SFV23_23480 [Planctomycetaceae bacterium]|nr:hypothetical protein [Planctomycetaceae bacterium]
MPLSRSLLIVATLVFAALLPDDVDAGVKGKRYVGFVKTTGGSLGDVIGLTYNFGNDGTVSAIENQDGGTFAFAGAYQETDLGVISFWSGFLVDGSPDGQITINGISFLNGLVSTINGSNLDIGLTSRGLIISTGSAQRSTNRGGSNENIGLGG